MADPHDQNVAAWRRLYRNVAPQPVKDIINAISNPFRRGWSDLRWSLMNDRQRRRWTARRMNLDQRQWLFVLGVNNSGTTLLTRILGLHPFISDLHVEGQRLTRAFPRPMDFDLQRLWSHRVDAFRWTEADEPAPALRAMYDWAPHFGRGRGYLLEKSPPNTVRSRWLAANFQPCRFIVVTRNPYAVAEGVRRRRSCTIEQAIEHWTRAHDVLMKDLPHLQHVLRVTYERLSDDTQAVLRDIERFLELPTPFDRDVLSREFNIHNMEDQPALIQNFNQRSIDRLTHDDIETINRIAGDVMRRVGYEPLVSSGSTGSG